MKANIHVLRISEFSKLLLSFTQPVSRNLMRTYFISKPLLVDLQSKDDLQWKVSLICPPKQEDRTKSKRNHELYPLVIRFMEWRSPLFDVIM